MRSSRSSLLSLPNEVLAIIIEEGPTGSPGDRGWFVLRMSWVCSGLRKIALRTQHPWTSWHAGLQRYRPGLVCLMSHRAGKTRELDLSLNIDLDNEKKVLSDDVQDAIRTYNRLLTRAWSLRVKLSRNVEAATSIVGFMSDYGSSTLERLVVNIHADNFKVAQEDFQASDIMASWDNVEEHFPNVRHFETSDISWVVSQSLPAKLTTLRIANPYRQLKIEYDGFRATLDRCVAHLQVLDVDGLLCLDVSKNAAAIELPALTSLRIRTDLKEGPYLRSTGDLLRLLVTPNLLHLGIPNYAMRYNDEATRNILMERTYPHITVLVCSVALWKLWSLPPGMFPALTDVRLHGVGESKQGTSLEETLDKLVKNQFIGDAWCRLRVLDLEGVRKCPPSIAGLLLQILKARAKKNAPSLRIVLRRGFEETSIPERMLQLADVRVEQKRVTA